MQTKSINGGLSMNKELERLYKLNFEEFCEIRKHIPDDEIDKFRNTVDNNLFIIILYREIKYNIQRIKKLDENV